MYFPDLETVRRLKGEAELVPVCREVLADMETPVSAFLKVADGPGSFLLESVEGGEHLARYSFVGTRPEGFLRLEQGQARLDRGGQVEVFPFRDPLDPLASLVTGRRSARLPGLPRFVGGAVGYLSYETATFFERIPVPGRDSLGLPVGELMLLDTLLVFDHLRRTITAITHVPTAGDVAREYDAAIARLDETVQRLESPRATGGDRGTEASGGHTSSGPVSGEGWRSNMSRDEFEASVRAAKEYIAAGDIIQVVLSQRFSQPCSADPFNIYRALRAINPSPYLYFLDYGRYQLIGASPELLVMVEDGQVSTHPIAGTRRRGATPEEDAMLAEELIRDEKERAEHVMLVDLGRNDVGRVSIPGSVKVPQLMEIERYSHVMHIVSHVVGRLRPELSSLDALRACFPAGTVSGAPKVRAMEIIGELEPERRGAYAGAVGFFGYDGNLETAITIRTIVLVDGVAHVQAGAGIVADSDPSREYEETVNKAAALRRALQVGASLTSGRDARLASIR